MTTDAPTALTLYKMSAGAPAIRAGRPERTWMDETPQRFAYRCLPLAVANCHGWEILCQTAFTACWDGGGEKASIEIALDAPAETAGRAPHSVAPGDNGVRPLSHFGAGVLTFEIPMLFRTSPGWNLFVTGPVNAPKDAIAPLSGIVETDWSPYTFTMNWRFTRPLFPVRFAVGEPIAHIFPVARGALDAIRPEIRELAEENTLASASAEWRESRSAFNSALEGGDAEAIRQKWQKTYFAGRFPDGTKGAADHQSKLRLSEFSAPETSSAD